MNAALAVGLRVLQLPTMIRVCDEPRALSEREGWSYEQFLGHLVECELSGRQTRGVERYLCESGLSREKSLSVFDMEVLPMKVRNEIPLLVEGVFAKKGDFVPHLRPSRQGKDPPGQRTRVRTGAPGDPNLPHPRPPPSGIAPGVEEGVPAGPGPAETRPLRCRDPGRHRLRPAERRGDGDALRLPSGALRKQERGDHEQPASGAVRRDIQEPHDDHRPAGPPRIHLGTDLRGCRAKEAAQAAREKDETRTFPTAADERPVD
jgi:hypothetical protein